MKLLARILKSPGCRKIPVIVQNTDDVVVSATNFVSERYVPQVSLFVTEFAYPVFGVTTCDQVERRAIVYNESLQMQIT